MLSWLGNIFIAFDQFINALIGGDPDETLSSRAGKAARKNNKIACIFCKMLDFFDKNHCEKFIEMDEGKRK